MSQRPQFDRKELAEEARGLIEAGHTGALSTMSQKQPGFPFGSVCPYATNEVGHPVILMSSLAVHSKNLRADPRASLLVTTTPNDQALQSGRVSILGTVIELADGEVPAVRQRYLAVHPESEQWISFGDFRFYRLQPVELYYVAGFGKMGWVTTSEFENVGSE